MNIFVVLCSLTYWMEWILFLLWITRHKTIMTTYANMFSTSQMNVIFYSWLFEVPSHCLLCWCSLGLCKLQLAQCKTVVPLLFLGNEILHAYTEPTKLFCILQPQPFVSGYLELKLIIKWSEVKDCVIIRINWYSWLKTMHDLCMS